MAGSVNKVVTDAADSELLDLYLEGNSIPTVLRKLSVPLSTVRNRLKKYGVLRSRTDAVRMAIKGKPSPLRGTTRVFTDDWKQNISKGRSAWADKNAKGFSQKKSGYVEITRGPNKGRSQHVVSMEDRIGRRLKADECVHHIDGDRSNNDDNNLALLTKSGHSRLHRFEDKLSGKIRERDNHGRFC